MQTVRQSWKLRTKRTWSPFMTPNPAKTIIKSFKKDKASDDFLRAMVDACISNVAVLDESGTILYASKAWRLFMQGPGPERFELAPYYFESCKPFTGLEFQKDAEFTLADDLQQILFGEEREFHRQYYCPLLNEGQAFVMHAARLNLPGSTFRVLMTHEDTLAFPEALKQTEERLTQLLEANKYLGSRLIAAQEEERKRVARELHDDLNQRMAVLSIELEQLSQRIEKPVNLRRDVEKLQLQVQEISTDIHRLSYKLHPSKLDHLGLAAAIKSLCDELSFMSSDKLKVYFHQSGVPSELPKDVKLCLFRIAQEVLRNCV